MPNVTNIEVFEGKEAPADATGEAKTSTAKKPEESSEVSGHHWHARYMRCWRCGGVSWIEWDQHSYHVYNCAYCGARNIV